MSKNSKIVGVIIMTLITVVMVVVTYIKTTNSSDILRVGYMRIASHSPLIFAIENNIFEKYKLKVIAEYYPTTSDLIEALEQRKIDVAFQVTPDLAWMSANKTKNDYYIYFVAQSTKDKPMDGFYAMKQINGADLINQSIGHFPGLTGRYMTQEVLKRKFNLDPENYNLVDVNPSMQLNMLTRGDIIALFTYEPAGTIAIKAYNAINIIPAPVEQYIINPWNGGIGIFSSDLVTYRKEVAVNFQKAIIESYNFLDTQLPEYTKALMDLQPGLTPEIAMQIPNIKLIFSTDMVQSELMRAAVAEQFKVYKDIGILNKDDSHYLKIFEPYEKYTN